MVVHSRKIQSIIRTSKFFLPYNVCNKMEFSENFIAQQFQVSLFIIIDRDENNATF